MSWPLTERAKPKTGDTRMFWGTEMRWTGSKWEPVDGAVRKNEPSAKSVAPKEEPKSAEKSNEEATILDKYKLKITGPGHEKLAKAVEQGIGKSADLCKINPPICRGNLGRSRDTMPQFPDDKVRDSFLEKLQKKGVRVSEGKMKVGQLRASQEEIQAKKTIGMAGAYLDGKFSQIKNAIVISKDGYIVDGHHRWAALLTVSPGEEMNVIRVGVPIKELLDMVNGHEGVEKRGLEAASIGQENVWFERSAAILERLSRSANPMAELKRSRMDELALAYTSSPVSAGHGVGVSPSASPADTEGGRFRSTVDGPRIRKRKKPLRAGVGSMVPAMARRS